MVAKRRSRIRGALDDLNRALGILLEPKAAEPLLAQELLERARRTRRSRSATRRTRGRPSRPTARRQGRKPAGERPRSGAQLALVVSRPSDGERPVADSRG